MVILDRLYHEAVFTYGVNPYVFAALFVLSLPFYYGGYCMMIKIGYRYFKSAKKLKLTGLLSERGFIIWLTINRFGWVLPYLYVVVYGRNLPVWIYALILVWLGATTYLLLKKIFKGGTK